MAQQMPCAWEATNRLQPLHSRTGGKVLLYSQPTLHPQLGAGSRVRSHSLHRLSSKCYLQRADELRGTGITARCKVTQLLLLDIDLMMELLLKCSQLKLASRDSLRDVRHTLLQNQGKALKELKPVSCNLF
jgi:hypothetical protein